MLVVVLLLLASYGPHLCESFENAFITYRYARNLAEAGASWNESQHGAELGAYGDKANSGSWSVAQWPLFSARPWGSEAL